MLADIDLAIREKQADCVCRPQPLTAPGNTLFQNIVARVRASLLGHGLDSTIFSASEGFIDPTSSGCGYRRSVFERVGLFDESFDACEDVEFNCRVAQAGLPAYSSDKFTIWYRPRSSVRSLFQQMVRYGRGRFRLIRKHPDAASIGQMVPAVWVLWITFGLLASSFSPVAAWALAGTLAFYFGAVLTSSLILGAKYNFLYAVLAPLIYVVIHGGLGLGFLAEAASSLTGYSKRRRNPGRECIDAGVAGMTKPQPSAAPNTLLVPKAGAN